MTDAAAPSSDRGAVGSSLGPRAWMVAGVILLVGALALIGWWTTDSREVRQVNHTLSVARTAVQHVVRVDREVKAQTEHFTCCGASGPSGSFDGLLIVSGRDALRGAERVATALRSAGWHTWQYGQVLDAPLEVLDAQSVIFDAAPASALEALEGGQGVEVIVHLLDATDAELSSRHTGELVVGFKTWAQSIYAPT